jgi:hypothetical protein
MIERAWVAMRAIGDPIPPEEISITTIPAARRALDIVRGWLHRRDTDDLKDWSFSVGGFRYKNKSYQLAGQKLALLEAFVNAHDTTLSHREINNTCSAGFAVSRHHQYVSELNRELRRFWRVKDNPVQPIRGSDAYRLYPPCDDLRPIVGTP